MSIHKYIGKPYEILTEEELNDLNKFIENFNIQDYSIEELKNLLTILRTIGYEDLKPLIKLISDYLFGLKIDEKMEKTSNLQPETPKP